MLTDIPDKWIMYWTEIIIQVIRHCVTSKHSQPTFIKQNCTRVSF